MIQYTQNSHYFCLYSFCLHLVETRARRIISYLSKKLTLDFRYIFYFQSALMCIQMNDRSACSYIGLRVFNLPANQLSTGGGARSIIIYSLSRRVIRSVSAISRRSKTAGDAACRTRLPEKPRDGAEGSGIRSLRLYILRARVNGRNASIIKRTSNRIVHLPLQFML